MGCGRVGSSLAAELEAAGHSVAIIDQSREAFRRLGPDFKGRTVTVLASIATPWSRLELKLHLHSPL
jgi:Trk K+ transport system NAD-binding subunit